MNNEEALVQAVSQQPVSMGIEGTGAAFRHYSGGIFNGECGTDLHHAVTVVGYGMSEEGTKYWVVKNSWGETWGENGYMRIKRDVDAPQGMCGLAILAFYPLA
ncbi:Peptidase C1A papain C-terminal [Arabidopsis suecica]|uniref:Peptidase C1A papain C-terminal n=1 Tax=Arabidopsis suecica TaxID=45249 RepID=A0A8T2G244_ARASU|nr:Peptidase C1A papain C-terminal [Arabidopsis suecica]